MIRPIDTSLVQRLPLSTDVALQRRFMVVKQPLPGNVRFGLLLEVVDKLAEDVALRHARRTEPGAYVVTAAIEKVALRTPGDVNRDIDLQARLNWVGKSSMEVGIRVEQPGVDPGHVASCYFTMVARVGEGEAARSVEVEPLDYREDIEARRRDKAVRRRETYRRRMASPAKAPTPEEYQLLARLHAAQEQPGFSGRLAGRLTSMSWERMYPELENVPSKVFGGYLVRRAYELATIQAEEIAPDRPVIVRVNRINFLQPVRIGDKLRLASRVVYTGRTSVTVEVTIERISWDRVTRAPCNTCVFTFVNVDERMTARPVEPVYPTTYAEDARYLEVYRWHRRLKARRAGLVGREAREGRPYAQWPTPMPEP
jgi:acyl-coenzyme A thioesterase 9